jgi:hypothetical protein
MKPKQPASAEYVFTQLNHVPVPYSLPGAAVMGHTKTVSTMGTTANSAMPAHSDVRPNSLNAISANKMNSQMTQYSGSVQNTHDEAPFAPSFPAVAWRQFGHMALVPSTTHSALKRVYEARAWKSFTSRGRL